jgi:hypothetical protein
MTRISGRQRGKPYLLFADRARGPLAASGGAWAAFRGFGLLGGVLGGSPKPLDQPVELDRIKRGVGYAVVGAALRRWLRRG